MKVTVGNTGKRNKWAVAEEMYILYGDFSTPGEWNLTYYSCQRMKHHPKYDIRLNRGTGPFNLALLQLDRGAGL